MSDLKDRLKALKQKLEIEDLKKQIKEIEKESAQSGFWQDHQKASAKMKKMAGLQREIEEV